MQRLTAKLDDPYDFISRYVELNQDGRGYCHFHPPDYHLSFAVTAVCMKGGPSGTVWG
jgi:hypothetical protein